MILSDIDIEKAKSDYANAEPFKFCVIDDVFREDVIDLIHKDLEYLIPDSKWHRYDNPIEKKYTTDKWEIMPSFTRAVLLTMNSGIVIDKLEEITGIKGLLPDPNLRGAGISFVLPGGKLDLHADRQIHPKLNVYRRLNALIYINKNWRDEWAGALELWNKDVTKCVHKISPIFNRLVLFETTATSFHGHPDPLRAPIGTSRKALSLYYWTATIPKGFDLNLGSTDFRGRPNENDPELEKFREERRNAVATK